MPDRVDRTLGCIGMRGSRSGNGMVWVLRCCGGGSLHLVVALSRPPMTFFVAPVLLRAALTLLAPTASSRPNSLRGSRKRPHNAGPHQPAGR